MNPIIDNIDEQDDILKFDIKNINVSCINSLRRVILSEIPCVVFETTPYEKNMATIYTNTTRFNNEILKQRLSCIPIHINDDSIDINDYIMVLDKKNTTDTIQYVTTEDFQIKNINTNKFLSKDEVNNIFPKNNITGDYIQFVRLRPNIIDTKNGEHIKLSCKFIRNIAKNNYSYNVASTCCYSNNIDSELADIEWLKLEKEYKNKKISNNEIKLKKKDFYLLDAKRYIINNSFNFVLESIGIYSNYKLIQLACSIINTKLSKFIDLIQNNPNSIISSNNTMDNTYDIILENEDYTLGKIIEYVLYTKYFIEKKELEYCGFIKKHPHDKNSIIRITLKDDISSDNINIYLNESVKYLKNIYKIIHDEFK